MTRITRSIRRDFTMREYNLVVGGIFTGGSLIGALLSKCLRLFEAWPKFWMVAICLILVTVAALAIAAVYRNDVNVQVVCYIVAVAPLALLFMSFIDRQFDDWTYTVIVKTAETSKEVTMNATNYVYGAAWLATLALAAMTVLAALLPNWLLRPKTTGVMALGAYLLGISLATILFGKNVVMFWTILFSVIPYIYVVFTWAYQISSIRPERAARTPICTFTQIVDWAKSVND